MNTAQEIFFAGFTVLLVLIWLRWISIVVFAVKQTVQERRELAAHLRLLKKRGWPPVSIIVPAYNEAVIIADTLERLCEIAYPRKEIIVVNDGSADETSTVIKKVLASRSDVSFIDQSTNRGKAAALNTGVARAAHDIIVTIDADTIISNRSLKYLLLCFMDPVIAAATSNVKVGNADSLLTRWQALEYITGLHTERRAQSYLGCITTLSGAACAYRKHALEQAGGFSGATLVEDTDMTLRLAARNVPMRFASRAVSCSEAPSSLRDLARQRFRWLYGSLQCIRLHFNGWLRTPNRALFGFGYPNFVYNNLLIALIYPLYLAHAALLLRDFSLSLLFLVLSFLLVEFLLSLFACVLAGERLRVLLHCVPQRVFYMFFLILIFGRCFWAFLMKRRPGWLKVKRSGGWSRV